MPDNITVWSVTLPQPYRPGAATYVIFRKGKIVIPSIAAGYPTQIYITASGGIVGMYNYESTSTGCMAAYGLSSVTSLGTTPPTYDVVYENAQDVLTKLPTGLQTLNLQVYYDENKTP